MGSLEVRTREAKELDNVFDLQGVEFEHNDEEGFQKSAKLWTESKSAAIERLRE